MQTPLTTHISAPQSTTRCVTSNNTQPYRHIVQLGQRVALAVSAAGVQDGRDGGQSVAGTGASHQMARAAFKGRIAAAPASHKENAVPSSHSKEHAGNHGDLGTSQQATD
jgi:hypothetical protein